ncbi:hypothetical protein MBANPS3_008723 [Mucor bainieri]
MVQVAMPFDETDANQWNLKDAFDDYHKSTDENLAKTLDKIKKDLESFKKKPNKPKKRLAELASSDSENERASQVVIENNITNNDSASTTQVFKTLTAKANASAPSSTNLSATSIVNNITNNDQSSSTQVYKTLATFAGKKRKMKERQEDFPNYQDQTKEWKTGDEDIGKAFQDYQFSMAKEATLREFQVERDTHAILALSNILFIKHGQCDETFDSHFSQTMIKLAVESVHQKFRVISVDSSSKSTKRPHFDMDPHSKTEVETIIKSVLRQEKSTKQAAKQITSLTTDEETNTTDGMLLFGVRNLIEAILRTSSQVFNCNTSASADTSARAAPQDGTNSSTDISFKPFLDSYAFSNQQGLQQRLTTKDFRAACNEAHTSRIASPNWMFFWSLALTLVQRNVIYRFITRTIPARRLLHYFKIAESPLCPICGTVENAVHMLFLCPRKVSVWKAIIFEFLWPTVSVGDIIQACSSLDFEPIKYVSKSHTTTHMVILVTLGNIWRAHFRVIFHSAPFIWTDVVQQIKHELQQIHDQTDVHNQL